MGGFVIRIVGGPARDEGVQVAVDSVTSAPDAVAHLLRGALEPVAVGSGYDEWSPTRGPERGCLDARPQPGGQQRLAVVGQHEQPEHRAHPARELPALARQGRRSRERPPVTDEPGEGARFEHDVHALLAHPAFPRAGDG